jgi:two-component system response regulator (stage 0 sporulation protein F)
MSIDLQSPVVSLFPAILREVLHARFILATVLPSATIDPLARRRGSARTGLRNSVLIENNRSVSCHATILIIDDDDLICVLLRSALEAAGYEVMEAANGREGLELNRYRPKDLVITDIVMPEMNGLDMLLELTREFLHTKVVAISGVGGEMNVLDVAKLLGARQIFQKPVSLPHLLAAVRYELEH